ncbi:hypothetical protein H6795_02345 [Candidatus Nomurabacteria bacterium]|nr:hypothetical protein [Candidatus Nomurabacteria bacterium]
MVPELVIAVAFWIALPELMTVVAPTCKLPLTRFRLSPVAKSKRLAAPRLKAVSPPNVRLPPIVALFVMARLVPTPVALSPPLKVEAVAVLAPLPVTVARVSASVNEVRQVAVVQRVPLELGRVHVWLAVDRH